MASSVQKIHRVVDALGAMVVTGHDPNEWPNFKKTPEITRKGDRRPYSIVARASQEGRQGIYFKP